LKGIETNKNNQRERDKGSQRWRFTTYEQNYLHKKKTVEGEDVENDWA